MVLKQTTQKIYIISIISTIILIFGSLCTAGNGSQQSSESDKDEDGMSDDWEDTHGLNSNNSSDAEDDNDGDGLNNLEEYDNGTDPNDPDTDDGGLNDSAEVENGTNPQEYEDDSTVDSDSDGLPDTWELHYQQKPYDASDAKADPDDDGYSNTIEFDHGTDPTDFDSRPSVVPDGGSGDDEDNKETSTMGIEDGNPVFLLLFIVIPIVLLLVIVLVYTKMRREQLLEHKVRGDIFNYITKNPGIHYRGIMNQLHLQMGVLTHHLNMLEQQQYIKSAQDGMYRRFYPKNAQVNSGLILSDVQEQILRAVQSTPGISQSEIARKLGLARKVVSYHMKILSDAGFVHQEHAGRESRCFYLDGLELDGAIPAPDHESQNQNKEWRVKAG